MYTAYKTFLFLPLPPPTHLVTGRDPQSSSYPSLQVGDPRLPESLGVSLEHAGPGRGHNLKAEPSLLVFGHLERADTQVLHHYHQLLWGEDY